MRLMTMAALAALMAASSAMADPWKDESGNGRGREDGGWKQEYRSGSCKIERKWEPSGEYKEEIKCDGPPPSGYVSPPPPPVSYRPVQPSAPLPPPPPGPSYGDIYRDSSGRYCREYHTVGVIDGRSERLYGTVCLQANGSWAFSD